METTSARFMSTPTYVEAYIVVTRRSGEESGTRLKRLLQALLIDLVEFTIDQADVAYARIVPRLREPNINLRKGMVLTFYDLDADAEGSPSYLCAEGTLYFQDGRWNAKVNESSFRSIRRS